jgi:hypothetical protein
MIPRGMGVVAEMGIRSVGMFCPRREVAVRPSGPVVVGSGSAGVFYLGIREYSCSLSRSRTNYRERLTASSGRVLRRSDGAERWNCVRGI